jgi:hypothetical protein
MHQGPPSSGPSHLWDRHRSRSTFDKEVRIQDTGYLRSVLQRGNERARQIAATTLGGVQELMHTTY